MPLTVTSRWLGKVRANSAARPVSRAPGSAATNSLGIWVWASQRPVGLDDLDDVGWRALDGQLSGEDERRQAGLGGAERRAVGLHLLIGEGAQDAAGVELLALTNTD